MKLIQLNIWQGKILIAVSRFLKDQDPDIICMQEVYSCEEFIPLLDNLSSLEILKEELNYPHIYFEPTFGFETNGTKASWGNAIFSKLPLEDRQVLFTNGAFQQVGKWSDDRPSNNRNALICTVKTPTGDITLVNHHGFHEFNPIGSEATVAAMKNLVDAIKTRKQPLVIAGDLNISAESPAMRLFDGWLEDLIATHNVRDTLTEYGKVRNVPCDHILISKDVQMLGFEVSNVIVSDHAPLVFEFNI